MEQNQLDCILHQSEQYNHFCLSKNCIIPLCKNCLEDHNQFHVDQKTHANYITIQKLLNNFEKMNDKNIQNLNEIDYFSNQFNKIYDQHVQKNRQNLQVIKQELYNQIDEFINKMQIKLENIERKQKIYFQNNLPQFNDQVQKQLKYSKEFQNLFQNKLNIDFIKNTLKYQNLQKIEKEIQKNNQQIQQIKDQFVNFTTYKQIFQYLQSNLQEYFQIHYNKQLFENGIQNSLKNSQQLTQPQQLLDTSNLNNDFQLSQELDKLKIEVPQNDLDDFQFSQTSTEKKQINNSRQLQNDKSNRKQNMQQQYVFEQPQEILHAQTKNRISQLKIDFEKKNTNTQIQNSYNKMNSGQSNNVQNNYSNSSLSAIKQNQDNEFDFKNDFVSQVKSSFKENIRQPNTYLSARNVYVNEQMSVNSNLQDPITHREIDNKLNNPYRRMLAVHKLEFDYQNNNDDEINQIDLNRLDLEQQISPQKQNKITVKLQKKELSSDENEPE